MRSYVRRIAIAAAAALTLASSPVVTSGAAQARPFGFHHGAFHHGGWGHGGWGHRGFGVARWSQRRFAWGHRGFGWGPRHFGWRHRGFGFGPIFASTLAFGALASAPYWYSSPVALYEPCVVRRRITGYTYWGRPIFRTVRVCY
jgi:hypothetical protein